MEPLDPSLAARLKPITAEGLSIRARLAHLALLLAAMAMVVLLASLLLSEPDLPARTRWSFAGMLPMALAWAGYAGWVLRQRWTLLPRHRIVAGRMAVAFSGLFTVVALGTAWVAGSPAAWAAGVTGLAFSAASAFLLKRAHARVQALEQRRALLEGREE